VGTQPNTVPQPFPYMPQGRARGGFPMYGGHGFGHGFEHHHGGGSHWIALLLFVLLVASLVVLAISVARMAFNRSKAAAAGRAENDALGTLRMRYARGEIGRDDFLLAHADLGGAQPPPEPAGS
jgi:uncharacterized membrane protein